MSDYKEFKYYGDESLKEVLDSAYIKHLKCGSIIEFAEKYLWAFIDEPTPLSPQHKLALQAMYDGNSLTIANRQVGKTLLMKIVIVYRMITEAGYDANVVSYCPELVRMSVDATLQKILGQPPIRHRSDTRRNLISLQNGSRLRVSRIGNFLQSAEIGFFRGISNMDFFFDEDDQGLHRAILASAVMDLKGTSTCHIIKTYDASTRIDYYRDDNTIWDFPEAIDIRWFDCGFRGDLGQRYRAIVKTYAPELLNEVIGCKEFGWSDLNETDPSGKETHKESGDRFRRECVGIDATGTVIVDFSDLKRVLGKLGMYTTGDEKQDEEWSGICGG